MAEVDVIAELAQPVIQQLRTADVLIAIPTFNNEQTIAAVVKAARTALLQFPKRTGIIAQFDGGSSDSTMDRAKDGLQEEACFAQVSYPVYPAHKLEVTHHSVPGKESAYHTIFSLAEQLDAKACCVVSGDAVVPPDWIASLVHPVLEMGFDLAAPLYQRRSYDGLLVNSILYPVIRALYGKRIRQPIGSDFGFSRPLIRRCLSLDGWKGESARRDIDLWMNVQAIQDGMQTCHVRLGARPRPVRNGTLNTSSILANIAGALYSEIERTPEFWQRVRGSSEVPVFGLRFDMESSADAPDVKPMIDAFRIGYRNLQEIWNLILPPATLLELRRMSRQSEHEFRYPGELWARTVYDFAVAHRLRSIGRDHLFGALTPLYMGWIASFVLSIRDMDAGSRAEQEIEKLCVTYESEKPYLISRWRWPDRFAP